MEPSGHQKPRPYYFRRKPRPVPQSNKEPNPGPESTPAPTPTPTPAPTPAPTSESGSPHHGETLTDPGSNTRHTSKPNVKAPASASAPAKKEITERKRGHVSSKKQPPENRVPMARPPPRSALSVPSSTLPIVPPPASKAEAPSTTDQALHATKQEEDPIQRCFSLQQSELVMIKIRYPLIQVVYAREQKEDTEETKFELDLPMTDPDFPFELESIHLLVMWPTHYPLRSCPRVILKDSNIPHNIGKKIQIFLDRELPRWQGEPCMRALLHFIDQNLEKWAVAPDPSSVTCSSGTIRFVPAPPKNPNAEQARTVRLAPPQPIQSSPATADMDTVIESRVKDLHLSASTTTGAVGSIKPLSSGTSICLVQPLLTQVALLKVITLSLRLVCSRCSRSFTAVPSLRPLPLRQKLCCPFCRVLSESALQPASYFPGCADGLLARVQVSNAAVVDLLPSDYILTCAACLPADESDVSNEVLVKAVGRGQTQYLACRACHTSLAFCINEVHFSLFPSAAQTAALDAKRGSSLKKKPAKGGFVPTPGKQLPDHGTCKHYKKSFRWLRFPCCGGAYPCDQCHELDNKDHEMQWANKMICGYCSKEQPFSQKPCACGKSLSTASQRKSTHWEGGKGARDPTTMSKKDSRKYKLMGAASSASAVATTLKKK